MKRKFRKSVIALSVIGLVFSSTTPSNAYWAWGPTWTNPGGSRYLYVWSNSFTSAQQTAINSANMAFDSSKTNAFDPADPGSSTLNISGTTFSTSVTAYDNASFKISRQTNTWAWSYKAVAITCFATCTAFTPGINKSSIYLNDVNYNFGTAFIGSGPNSTVDLQTIVLHELGHSHGLGHPDEIHSPMTPAEAASVMYVNSTIKRTLTSDDIKGLQVNY